MGKTRIVIVGSSAKDKGGIASVISGILNSAELRERFELRHIESYVTAGAAKRAAVFLAGLLRFALSLLLFRPHVVHVHMSYKGSFYRKSVFILLAGLFRVPVCAHMHGSSFQPFYDSLRPALQRYCSRGLNRCDRLIVLSESWNDYFSRIVPPWRVVTLYNAVAVPPANAAQFREGPRSSVHGLFLGRLGERKGVYDLLEAIRLLRRSGVPAVFTLAGDGEVERVRQLAEEAGLLDCVRIPGWVDGEVKEALLADADFLVLPSYYEGLPMSVLEAMSRGLPVVTTPVGGIPEVVVDGEHGFLVEPGDVEALADRLARMCADPGLRRTMGERGRAEVEAKYSMPAFVERLSGIYETLRISKAKVCLATSSGGHLSQMLQLLPVVKEYSYFLLTERNETTIPLAEKYKTYYLLQQERMNASFVWKAAVNAFRSAFVLLKERPTVIVTSGAGAVVPACLLGKLFGVRLVFIESFAKVNSPTMTGRLLYRFADEFYVQWEDLRRYYPRAKYRGTIY